MNLHFSIGYLWLLSLAVFSLSPSVPAYAARPEEMYQENTSPWNCYSLSEGSYSSDIDRDVTHYYEFFGLSGKTKILIEADYTPSFSFQLYSEGGDSISPDTYMLSKSGRSLTISYLLKKGQSYLFSLTNLQEQSLPYYIQIIDTAAKVKSPSKSTQQTKTKKPSKPTQQTKTKKPSKPTQQTKTKKPSKPTQQTKTKGTSKPTQQTKTKKPSKPTQQAKTKSSSKPNSKLSKNKKKKGEASLRLSQYFITLLKGKSHRLTARLTPSSTRRNSFSYQWKSTDPSVVSVSSGYCKAKKPGIALIICTLRWQNRTLSASCTIKVP